MSHEFGFRQKSQMVSQSRFSMVPRPDVPRSVFRSVSSHKTTFNASMLVPVYLNEVLPGDSYRLEMTAFARMATPIFPLMDNLRLDSFFFFVPNRLVWQSWKRFMGERVPNTDSTIDFVVPQTNPGPAQRQPGTIFDYFGLPSAVQAPNTILVNALPFRGYNLIYNEWFRDENLQNSVFFTVQDANEGASNYTLLRRGKRHDYFTSCLPWPQKGAAVTIPLGTSAPVRGIGLGTANYTVGPKAYFQTQGAASAGNFSEVNATVTTPTGQTIVVDQDPVTGFPKIDVDLSAAAAATVNTLRTSFQVQKLLERDARGGTRYTEILRAHFGVASPDSRLQRPEYLGGGSAVVHINPVAQTSATVSGQTPLGNLSGVGTSVAEHGFSQSFTEHGYVMGLVSVRADLTYQQGVERHWSRRTRYDYYFPAFAHLGEQAVPRKEIYCTGTADDDLVFGYQERWAEYRYKPSQITGLFRSGISGTLDAWHLAQNFSTAPVLGSTFISENVPMSRVLAAGELANNQQFLFDSVFDVRIARPMPTYSVPGFIDRF